MSAMAGAGPDVTEDHLTKRARQQQQQQQQGTKQSPLMTAQQVQQANANMWQSAVANMTPQQVCLHL